ncbi:FAD-binding oxidoreductase [Bacillus cereus group sp. BfR-BA-01383]|uniref:NAD(P)/FAD-dependent oxidoreductase n=1 Tax=Bacillus cereus group sp. BfR-BA-01383 TaxID=2920327 RepID=UPI001F57BE56|nr:FAD-dependent oxidoreductase [Bacillus cereus group sp. BfR-BA-01383]
MLNNRTFDVVVVGNGVLGLSLALTLTRKKLKVALVGESHRPYAATTAAGAMLGTFGEVTATLLKSKHGRLKHDFAVRARNLWDDWLAELEQEIGDADIVCADGTIVMLNTVGLGEIDTANYEAIRTSLQHYNEPFEDIDPVDIEWLDPETTSRPLRALYIPNEHAVDSNKLLDRLERAFIRLGGTLIHEKASGLEYERGQVNALVLSSNERLISNRIVLAAGAKTQELLDSIPDVSARIPRLVSGYGVSALVSTEDGTSPKSVIRTPNRAFACGLHIVPRQQGEVYVGATNIISPQAVETPLLNDVTFLLDCAYRQIRRSLAKSRMSKLQVGNRPVSLDGFPLLGETDLNGLFVMTGTYRDGLTLSPYLAREMAKLVCGEEMDTDLKEFQPVRSPIQPMTRKETITEAIDHMLATGYESDWRIPVEWKNIIEFNMYPSYEKYTAELDSQFTPPADLLAASRVHTSIADMLRHYYAAVRNEKSVGV